MSGFRLTGGSQRGGKMAEAARAMGDHEMERREAALRAAATHLGWTVEDVNSLTVERGPKAVPHE